MKNERYRNIFGSVNSKIEEIENSRKNQQTDRFINITETVKNSADKVKESYEAKNKVAHTIADALLGIQGAFNGGNDDADEEDWDTDLTGDSE